jgi:hypothetical protein
MLKPTANYRMSKTLKTSLALSGVLDPHARGAWKRSMVQAELYGALAPKKEKRDNRGPSAPVVEQTTDTE